MTKPFRISPWSRNASFPGGLSWENGYNESFNGKLDNELLAREIFYTLEEARVPIERWHPPYNQVRPRRSLGYRPPAQVTITPGRADPRFAILGRRPDRPALRSRTRLT